MRRLLFPLACLLSVLPFCRTWADDWPQFRGPTGQGHAQAQSLPLQWPDSQNIAWKTAIPGLGWSSPVILGEQVWLTTAQEDGKSLRAVCVHRDSGKVLHNVEVFKADEALPANPKNSHASPTPVLEPGRLYVHFGSAGTACLDTATGKILWADRSLVVDHKEGPGSSPILWRDKLIVNMDGRDERFVVAFDKATGKIAWQTDRSAPLLADIERNKAYCTPLIVEHNGRDVLVSPGAMRVSGYDPSDGKELWWVDYNGFSNVPRPVAAHGLVYVCTGYMRGELLALRPDGSGDITQSGVAWKFDRQVPNNPSPLVVGERLYMVSDRGILTCLNALTGEELWTERLGGNFSASPLFAAGHIYVCSEQGEVIVFAPGDAYQELARTDMEQRVLASPAVADNALFLRTEHALYRIESPTPRPSAPAAQR